MSTVEERIKALEDVEAIKKMKAAYAYAIDERRWDDVLDCFTENALVDFGSFGIYRSKGDLAKFFNDWLAKERQMTRHLFHNPIIEVQGNTARGQWYFNIPAVERGVAMWTGGKYDDEYVREAGQWKHSKCLCTFAYNVTYQAGWTGK